MTFKQTTLNNSNADYWVFGYGSLMWRPGFPFAEMAPARLNGWRRDMCIQSIHYRGTPDVPGLVSGLTPGGECLGRAYKISPDDVEQVVAYLDERELVTDVYLTQHLDVDLLDGRSVPARVYVADTNHDQFAGHWSVTEKIKYLLQGTGSEGRSIEYLSNIVEQLELLKIADPGLVDLLRQAQALETP
ncbi:MAG: gamma-glutamylcyclotransferase [Rhodospirillaceae bacterium]